MERTLAHLVKVSERVGQKLEEKEISEKMGKSSGRKSNMAFGMGGINERNKMLSGSRQNSQRTILKHARPQTVQSFRSSSRK